MKFVEPPCADPEKAARKIMEIATGLGTPAEWKAGLDYAIAKGLICARAALTPSLPRPGRT
ncbi:hypothetical protein [Bradyrhizobium lablabi]|uniref:hypothetical protein n=1 Tax=Bradyrhizobium lablabi TaxID=722472 RepID=UPI001BAC7200|nr:hypothetical protein [Bradyrhizobium lablabi]MBR0695835.1 hypothetical protein [Bradyrhizobium lablabi]